MNSDPWTSPRLSEDLQPVLEGGPEDYAFTTQQAVQYVVVANDSGVLGYLWAADADDAAGFEPRPAGGDEAFNAGVSWTGRLRRAKARRLSPSEAVTELSREAAGGAMGHVVPGSQAEAPSLTALKELAGRG